MKLNNNENDKIKQAFDGYEVPEDYFDFLEKNAACHKRIQLAVMPHAVYTVGDVLWRRCAETAQHGRHQQRSHQQQKCG